MDLHTVRSTEFEQTGDCRGLGSYLRGSKVSRDSTKFEEKRKRRPSGALSGETSHRDPHDLCDIERLVTVYKEGSGVRLGCTL
jgi:hypothetical protein